jgi:hypothetical protein
MKLMVSQHHIMPPRTTYMSSSNYMSVSVETNLGITVLR